MFGSLISKLLLVGLVGHSLTGARATTAAMDTTGTTAATDTAATPDKGPSPASPGAKPSLTANELAVAVQARYRSGGDMTADFVQVYTDKLRQRRREERGKLWVKTDGRVRWSYTTPQHKDFIFNGSSAFFYEPDNAQVTVFEQFADSPLSHAMQFLWGAGDLVQGFGLQLLTEAADLPALQPGEQALLLRPKQAVAAVDHVYLLVDPRAQRVRQSRVVDPLGNTTDYSFSAVSFAHSIDAARFAFKIPEGVSVLRASAQ